MNLVLKNKTPLSFEEKYSLPHISEIRFTQLFLYLHKPSQMLCNFPGGAVILGHIKYRGMASEKLVPNYTYYILFNLN